MTDDELAAIEACRHENEVRLYHTALVCWCPDCGALWREDFGSPHTNKGQWSDCEAKGKLLAEVRKLRAIVCDFAEEMQPMCAFDDESQRLWRERLKEFAR